MWTVFKDNWSGGCRKTEYEYILIEGAEDDAIGEFDRRFNRSPFHCSCECCGGDFSIWEVENFDKAMEVVDDCMNIFIVPADMQG